MKYNEKVAYRSERQREIYSQQVQHRITSQQKT
jgi:hypothetical protein